MESFLELGISSSTVRSLDTNKIKKSKIVEAFLMPPPDREKVMETREEEDFTAAPIEDQLVRFYQNLNPSKLKVIPFLLAKYGTRVVELKKQLLEQYELLDPLKTIDENWNEALIQEHFAAQLTDFYKKYNPSKVNQIPTLLEKYENRIEELKAQLLRKYGLSRTGLLSFDWREALKTLETKSPVKLPQTDLSTSNIEELHPKTPPPPATSTPNRRISNISNSRKNGAYASSKLEKQQTLTSQQVPTTNTPIHANSQHKIRIYSENLVKKAIESAKNSASAQLTPRTPASLNKDKDDTNEKLTDKSLIDAELRMELDTFYSKYPVAFSANGEQERLEEIYSGDMLKLKLLKKFDIGMQKETIDIDWKLVIEQILEESDSMPSPPSRPLPPSEDHLSPVSRGTRSSALSTPSKNQLFKEELIRIYSVVAYTLVRLLRGRRRSRSW